MQSWIIEHKRLFQYGVTLIVGIAVLSAIGTYWISFWNALRFAVAGMFIFLIPGWCVTLIFFPDNDRILEDRAREGKQHSLDLVERLTLAVILSIIISSAVVFALNIMPGEKLTPRNLAVGFAMTNLVLGAVAAWRKKRLSRRYVFPVALFPLVVIVLNWLGVALTIRNFAVEVLGLLLIIIGLWVVTKR